jgi:hypothetical protein
MNLNIRITYFITKDDFFLDLDQELGKGGCGVVVVGESKDTHAQYAIKIVSKGAG